MSRACGKCGQPGHNRRTCKHPAVLPPHSAEPASELDPETVEAIEWYMESNYPGYRERRRKLPDRGVSESNEEEEP